MKSIKKLLPFLLSIMMIVTAFAVTASAAGGATNVSMVVSATEVNVGDTVTVTVSYSDMTISSFACTLKFDKELLECVSLVGCDTEDPDYMYDIGLCNKKNFALNTAVSTTTEANGNGQVGFAYAGSKDVAYTECVLYTATFTAKAAGTVTFTLVEDSSGTDGFKDTADTKDLTIKATTPAHTCSVDTLTKTEESPADCTTDGVKAYWTCSCGKIYADAAATVEIPDLDAWKTGDGKISASHKYGELIQATEAIHTATELKPAVAAHYLCACGQYFDDNKVETTLAALTGETPKHTHNKYDDINATTHQSYCACGAKVGEAEEHDYSYDATNHKCDCGEVERFLITMDANGGKFGNGAPVYAVDEQYGVLFGAVPSDPTKENCKFIGWNTKADGSGDSFVLTPDTWKVTGNLTIYAQWCDHATTTTVNNNDGTHDITCTAKCGEVIADNEPHNYKTGYTCVCGAKFTGWDGVVYVVDAVVQKTGWTKIDDAWYYLDTATGERATGVARVPYNTELGYAADQETAEYYKGKNETFVDATDALFVFGEDGKFQSTLTGVVTYLDTNRYVVNGLLVWNPGFVTVGEELYYFIGDEENGGNVPADGRFYVVRANGVDGYANGDVVLFENGKPGDTTGIVDGYYYVNGKLARGEGLIKIENDYYYVRSAGQVAVGEYWITKTNDTGVIARNYIFDENGKMQNPAFVKANADGVVDGYYYVDGEIAYGAGLVELDDGSIIYVRSNGQLATGKYWPTTLNDVLPAGEYDFGADGVLVIK